MRPTPESEVCRLGHTATTAELVRAGETPRSIAAAVRIGAIRRAVQGVYVCSHADAQQRAATEVHGRIDCLSALRRAGVWSGFDDRLHLRVSPHASRLAVATSPAAPFPPPDPGALWRDGPRVDRVALHWSPIRFAAASASLVSPRDALLQSLQCLDEENAIAALESAVHEGFITRAELAEVCAMAPLRLAAGIGEIELTSHSGYETILRRRLRHAGFRVVAQGELPGAGHQDLVVEDLVGIEADGRTWHDTASQFIVDHDRDIRSMSLGRGVLRLAYREIFLYWETSLLAIERAVADARDLKRYRGR